MNLTSHLTTCIYIADHDPFSDPGLNPEDVTGEDLLTNEMWKFDISLEEIYPEDIPDDSDPEEHKNTEYKCSSELVSPSAASIVPQARHG